MAVFHGPRDEEADEREARSSGRSEGRDLVSRWLLAFLSRNRGRVLGVSIGLAFAFGVMFYGFLWTLFISGCGVVGYYVGKRLDENQEGLLEFLDRVLPPGRD